MPLTDKQHIFVQAYAGDPVEAARLAGYSGNETDLKEKGNTLLANPKIIAAIRLRSDLKVNTTKAIADREERQTFWTNIMRNEDPHVKPDMDKNGVPMPPPQNIPMATRLKASEMLGKSEADFMEKLDISGNVSVTDIITQAYQLSDDDYEEIEEVEVPQLPEPEDTEVEDLI